MSYRASLWSWVEERPRPFCGKPDVDSEALIERSGPRRLRSLSFQTISSTDVFHSLLN
jgi:hypothetical protein